MNILSLGLLLFCLFSASASADHSPAYPVDEKKDDFRVNLGWAVGIGPDFFGGTDLEFKHRPMVDIRYKDRLHIFGPKMRYALYKKAGLSIGPVVTYSVGRKEGDNPMLGGLGDNTDLLEVGAFLHYKKDRFRLWLEGRSGLGDKAGEILTLTMIQGIYRRDKMAVLMVLRSQYYSQTAMQRHFGVTDRQSAASVADLPVFKPSSGISHGNLILLGEYKIKKHLSLLFVGSYWHLLADAKGSPIVQGDFGSRSQTLLGTAFIYKF